MVSSGFLHETSTLNTLMTIMSVLHIFSHVGVHNISLPIPSSTVTQLVPTVKSGASGDSTNLGLTSSTVTQLVPTVKGGASGDSASGDNLGLIIGLTVGVFVIILMISLLIAVLVVARLKTTQGVTEDVNQYDYVGPPELPPRPIPTNANTAYANNIQTEQNIAYAGL